MQVRTAAGSTWSSTLRTSYRSLRNFCDSTIGQRREKNVWMPYRRHSSTSLPSSPAPPCSSSSS